MSTFSSLVELQTCVPNEIIASSILLRREGIDNTIRFILVDDTDALENLEYNKYSYHEMVISSKPRKFMLDIDLDGPLSRAKVMRLVDYFRRTVAKVVSEICKNWDGHIAREDDLHLFLSPNVDGTLSGFHLVLSNFMFSGSADIDIVFSAVQAQHKADSAMLAAIDPKFAVPKILDPAVLRKTFSMRIVRSAKLVSRQLVRPKEYCPTDTQKDEDNDLVEHGILTETTESGTHNVKLMMSTEQAAILHDDDIEDAVLDSAVKRIMAVKLGSLSVAECFHFRSAKGSCLSFDKSNAAPVYCPACKREHDGDNFLYAIGEGIATIGDTIVVMCRKSKKPIEKLLPESKYPFDLKAVQSLGKVDATNALKKQKKDHKEAILDLIREKENAFRVDQAKEGTSVSARQMKEKFEPEKRKMVKELEDSFFNATKTLCKTNEVGEISVESLKQYLEENRNTRMDVAKYDSAVFDQLDDIVFSSIEDLVTFIFSTYWWSTHDGLFLKESKGWKHIADTADGLCPRLITCHAAKVQCGAETVRFSGYDLWKPMAIFCRKEECDFIPEPCTLTSEPRYSMNPVPRAIINKWVGLTGKYALQQHFNPERHGEFIRELEYLLLNNLSDGQQEYFDYLVSWLASCMQRPHEKTGVLILLSGRRGIGKSQLISALTAIVPHARQDTKGIANLTGRFNAHLESSTLYMFPESPQSSGASAAEFAELKSLITESDEFTIEKKGIDQKQVQLYHNYLVASNFNSSVELEDGDRRFCIIPNQDAPHGHEDKEYWKKMHPMLNSVEFRASFQRYLLSRDITNFDVHSFPRHEVRDSVITRTPITEFVLSTPQFRQRLIDSCRSTITDENHRYFGDVRIDPPTLEAIVQLYARDNKLTGNQISYQVKKLRHEVNENEELRKVMRLYEADRMGLSTHMATLESRDGESLGTEERQYSHAIFFLDDESEGTATVDQTAELKCRVVDLERQLAEMKQLLSAAAEKNTISDPALLKLVATQSSEVINYATWTTPRLQAELRKRQIKFLQRDSKAVLLSKLA